MKLGTLYPRGYAALDADQQVEVLMQSSDTLLLDIRLNPTSRWRPQWRKSALQERWRDRYIHKRDLGNVNYRNDQPIQLLNPARGIEEVAQMLRRGSSLVVLCACKDYEMCHRHTVVELLKIAIPEIEVK
ncbi:hypothetical protein KDH_31730 [Dictyobacter sp. S3.2.2.5]|uniref:DUF488 domain-containing protein n=1 Tax=Dictyobacter halimunensis TaxID=3026934 RepID=A0ABQ6FPY0_9CHLR|nr:hypothetical protein KDH_31730 [Dictyobacter sp. S3.2.2.5]